MRAGVQAGSATAKLPSLRGNERRLTTQWRPVFWDMTICNLADKYQRLGGVRISFTLRMLFPLNFQNRPTDRPAYLKTWRLKFWNCNMNGALKEFYISPSLTGVDGKDQSARNVSHITQKPGNPQQYRSNWGSHLKMNNWVSNWNSLLCETMSCKSRGTDGRVVFNRVLK